MKITCLTVDCAEPMKVAEFWNQALGWGGVASVEDGHGAVCGPRSGGMYLEFIRVPEPKQTEKNRLHLGCSFDSFGELDNEIARLVSLGASVAWEEEFDQEVAAGYRNVILRDVEGNEFCLGAGSLPTDRTR